MPDEPTQLEREQAPAKKLLADIRMQKIGDAETEIAALFPGHNQRKAALELLVLIIEGRVPWVSFNG